VPGFSSALMVHIDDSKPLDMGQALPPLLAPAPRDMLLAGTGLAVF
jgi:hypothetical protein